MCKKNNLVSVIMPTYNSAKFISESINSVLSQTYKEWELIIFDDCSNDNTKHIVEKYKETDSRILYYRNEKNSGAALTRNNALKIAKGRWIAFLDSDDIWDPLKLEKQIKFMIINNYHFSYHEYIEIDEKSNEMGIYVSGKKKVNKFDMYTCCWPGCLSVMYDYDYFGLIQIKDIKKNNDTLLWLKIITKSNCYLLKENLGKYRRRKGSITPINISTKIVWHYKLLRQGNDLNVLFSIFLTCINIVGNSYKKIFYKKKYTVK